MNIDYLRNPVIMVTFLRLLWDSIVKISHAKRDVEDHLLK